MSAKRWVALVAAAVLFLGMVYVAGRYGGAVPGPAGPWQEAFVQGEGPDKIAVIDVVGEIVETGRLPEAAVAPDLVSQLQQAGRDDAVRAVVLDLNTPGGSVVASDQIHEAVVDLGRAGKPVVASMGEVAASGGYYIATGAQRIVANPSTFTGSIGVILVLVNLEGTAGKLGVEPIIIKSGRLKDIGSPFSELTEEERQIFQEMIDQSYDRFVDVVAEGRHMSDAEVRELATGRPYTGAQARDLGLVDRLGNFDTAVETARRLAGVEQATVVRYEPPFSLGALFGDGFPGLRSPVEELERSVGVTGPALKYLYVA
ncbi:MAG: signal peptide peptidase SppA [Actinomycetota bacterium]